MGQEGDPGKRPCISLLDRWGRAMSNEAVSFELGGYVADDLFSADIRLQREAGRTPQDECLLQLSREDRCPEL
jgi:hypothetical protein